MQHSNVNVQHRLSNKMYFVDTFGDLFHTVE